MPVDDLMTAATFFRIMCDLSTVNVKLKEKANETKSVYERRIKKNKNVRSLITRKLDNVTLI